uniref:Telomerase Cajal body protein 1 n=1 Tax=Chenopodium quinoa TaxID=63459 RepID=A0A803LL72_CHEQI
MAEEQPQQEDEQEQHFEENDETIDNQSEVYSWPEIRSPDGSCFLTSSDDNTFRLFSLPDNESDYPNGSFSSDPDEDSYAANLVINEGESVYDYCWYPYMSASDTTSCVFATTTRDHPIHLWDSTTGELRCTYRAFDAMDEITAAFSVAFNPTGTKIFAGYNKTLRVFDVHRPGKDFKQHSTLQGSKEGQSGIISAIAFSPANSGMFATGSYDQTTAIYSEDNMELLYLLHGQEGGITHLQFSKDGNYLYTGARKVRLFLQSVDIWAYKKLWLYRSTEHTNQRISFDIEPIGRHLGTGGQDGLVHIYDLQTGQWASSFAAASDTVNGFSFHPFLPMAVTSSGHRRFGFPDDADDAEVVTTNSNENCASVWGFSYTSAAENMMSIDNGDSDPKLEDEKL